MRTPQNWFSFLNQNIEFETDFAEIKENITNNIILVGDFNAHLGDDSEGIEGNHLKIGTNGKEYRRFIKDRDIKIINGTEKSEGIWTRVEGDKKSILDLTLTTKEMEEKIIKLKKDEDHTYAIESKRSKTDHNLSIVEINMNTVRERKNTKEKWYPAIKNGINTKKLYMKNYPNKVTKYIIQTWKRLYNQLGKK